MSHAMPPHHEDYRVLRFWNNDMPTNREGVLMTILAASQ